MLLSSGRVFPLLVSNITKAVWLFDSKNAHTGEMIQKAKRRRLAFWIKVTATVKKSSRDQPVYASTGVSASTSSLLL